MFNSSPIQTLVIDDVIYTVSFDDCKVHLYDTRSSCNVPISTKLLDIRSEKNIAVQQNAQYSILYRFQAGKLFIDEGDIRSSNLGSIRILFIFMNVAKIFSVKRF